MKRTFVSKLFDVVFPPKCAVCGTAVTGDTPMCPTCRSKWESAKMRICGTCTSNVCRCRCGNFVLYKNGVRDHLKLVYYEKDGFSAANNVIFSVKRSNDRLLFMFLADELSKILGNYLSARGIERRRVLLTYPPRTASAINAAGYDQAAKISAYISENLGIELRKTVVRRGGKIQKKLDGGDRNENARKSIFPLDGLDVSGRVAVVFDDVVTTGATVGRMAQILYSAGADEVIALSVAKSKRKQVADGENNGISAENE